MQAKRRMRRGSPRPTALRARNGRAAAQFRPGRATIDVLRGIDLTSRRARSSRCSARRARANRPCCRRSGCSKAASAASIRIAARKRRSSTATSAPRVRRDRLGFVYQFHHLLPDFNATENVVLPQLIHGATSEAAHERAQHAADRARARPSADPPPQPVVGRRAAAGRGRARARQPARAGAGRRADRQPRRGDRRRGPRRIPAAGARAKARPR